MRILLLLFLMPFLSFSHSSDLNVLIGHKAENYAFDYESEGKILYSCKKKAVLNVGGSKKIYYDKNCILFSDNDGESFDTVYRQQYIKQLSYKNFTNKLTKIKIIQDSIFIAAGKKIYYDNQSKNTIKEKKFFFLRSDDYGKTWDSTELEPQYNDFSMSSFDMHITKDRYIICYDTEWESYYLSDDQGISWRKMLVPHDENYMRNVWAFYDSSRVIIYGKMNDTKYHNKIYVSEDEGETWNVVDAGNDFYYETADVKIRNNNIYIGAFTEGNFPVFARTTTEFDPIVVLYEDESLPGHISNISLNDDLLSITLTEKIIRSTDNGVHWEDFITFSYDTLGYVVDSEVINNTAYILTRNNWLLKYDAETNVNFTHKPKVEIYPNPADDYIMVEFNKTQNQAGYEILNSRGVIINKGLLTSMKNKIFISGIPSGIYFIKIIRHENTNILKFLKR